MRDLKAIIIKLTLSNIPQSIDQNEIHLERQIRHELGDQFCLTFSATLSHLATGKKKTFKRTSLHVTHKSHEKNLHNNLKEKQSRASICLCH